MYTIKKKENIPGSIVEIQIEIPAASLEKNWPKALKHIGEHVNLPGFRKGHIPEKTLIAQVGEMAILEEAAEHAIEDIYGELLKEEKLNPLGNPKVVITKIAKGAPLEATLRIATFPEVTLPDYKSLSEKVMAKKETPEVTEKEVADVVAEIKKYRSKEGEENTEITDEFVKTIGDFKDVADFTAKIKENLLKEKKYKAKEKKRIEAIEAIREKTKIDVPEVLVDSELDRMAGEFSHELSKMGSTFEKYLGQIKKTEEEVKEEWKEKAKKRVENEIIIFEIAKKEDIKANTEDIDREVAHLVEHYPGTSKDRLIAFATDMLSKEEVFKFLESQK